MLKESDVRSVIAEVVPAIDSLALNLNAEFATNGIDSLDFAAILLVLQEKYGLVIPDEDLQQNNSIGKILAYAANRSS